MQNQKNNSFLVFKGRRIKAVYQDQVLEEYRGNPCIEALPPIYSKLEVIRKLSKVPDCNAEERNLPEHYRFHCIQKLFDFFEPLQKHIDIEQRFSRIIRQGYICRNPLSREYAEGMHLGNKLIMNGEYSFEADKLRRTTAAGFTIIGISGIGKTSSIERVLSLYPQVIHHTMYDEQKLNLYQIPWLKLDCPFDGSLKGLCINFFHAVDELLGTDYLKKFGTGRNSIDNMLPRMEQVANLHSIGVLIVDEIQHLSLAKSGGSSKMLNFFVTLVNTIGIPVILIGTTKALPVLQGEFRQARRGSGQGDLLWDRMKNDDSWKLLIQGMWPLQWTKKESILTHEIIDTLYDKSQGIVDIAVKLYAMAQIKAIGTGKEIVTSATINQVAKESLKLVNPMLEALRSGNKKEIQRYEDITPINFDDFYNENLSKISIASERKEADDNELIKEYCSLKLAELGIATRLAEECVLKALEANSGCLDKTFIVKEAMKLSFEKEIKKDLEETKSRLQNKKLVLNDLRHIVEEGRRNSKSAYDSLKEAGYIRNPVEEFIDEGDLDAEFFPQSVSR